MVLISILQNFIPKISYGMKFWIYNFHAMIRYVLRHVFKYITYSPSECNATTKKMDNHNFHIHLILYPSFITHSIAFHILTWLYANYHSILPSTTTTDLQQNNGLQREIGNNILFLTQTKKWTQLFCLHSFFLHPILHTDKSYHFYTYCSYFVPFNHRSYI